MQRNPLYLKQSIERSSTANPGDVLKVKTALDGLGFYELPDFGMTPYPDETMFTGIEEFQSANGLKNDGIMKPNGPTVDALWKKVSEVVGRSRADARHDQVSRVAGSCPEGYHSTIRRICIPGTDVCWDREVCVPIPSGGGGRG